MEFGRKQMSGILLTIVLFGVGILIAASNGSSQLQPVATIAIVAGFAMGYATIGWVVIPPDTSEST